MVITYLHHSCFYVETEQAGILFDYFEDDGYVPKNILGVSKPLYVLSSHRHKDHFSRSIFTWREKRPDIRYILSKDILMEGLAKESDGHFIEKHGVYQDGLIALKAFGSTDEGVSFYIKTGEGSVFHAGDLNNWHWNEEAGKEESLGYERAYHKELKDIAREINHVDVCMFPVDRRLGKDYWRGAAEFMENIDVHAFVPMHFWGDYNSANAFRDAALTYCKEFFEIQGKYEKMTF